MNPCKDCVKTEFHNSHLENQKDHVTNMRKKSSLINKHHTLIVCHVFIAVFFHTFCCLSAEPVTTTPRVSSIFPTIHNQSQITTTAKQETSLKPSHRLKYKLQLYNSGPAVLDSVMKFWVELIPQNQSTSHWPYRYRFDWMNMANMEVSMTEGSLVSEKSFLFSSNWTAAGDYVMTVAAFEKYNPLGMVAFETKMFTLTEHLNGHILVQQFLEYQRFPNAVFSTNVKTQFTVEERDTFLSKQHLSYNYKWFENGAMIHQTKVGTYSTTIGLPTNLTVRTEVLVKLSDSLSSNILPELRQATYLNNGSSLALADFLKHGIERKQVKEPLRKRHEKVGNFTTTLKFKDPLTSCIVFRMEDIPKRRSVAVGSAMDINVTCSGSVPSSVCWTTSAVNSSYFQSCDPIDFLPTTKHHLEVILNETGWINVHFFIYNDVSKVHINKSYYAYNPGSGSGESSALYLPIVFGVIGASIIVIGAIYVMRLRKKQLVEVADFDFHPSLTSSIEASNSIRISRMMSTLKYFFSARNRDLSANIISDDNDFSRSSSPLSGSAANSKAHSLYESL